MKIFKEKPCRFCGTVFQPHSPCNLYCSEECSSIVAKERLRVNSYNKWVRQAEREGRAHVVGVGKGGSNKKFTDHPQYKNGIGQFSRLREEVKQRRFCERCSKDLIDVSNFHWCAHHIDHDRTNNVIENLELLCKRCHQLEHECWKAFEGATTIPQGSRDECPEAPDTQNG